MCGKDSSNNTSKQKNKNHHQNEKLQSTTNISSLTNTVQNLLLKTQQQKVHYLQDFLQIFVPNLSIVFADEDDEGQNHDNDSNEWLTMKQQFQETLISPFDESLKPLDHIYSPIRHESLSSLIDGVIWSLVQQRQQQQPQRNNRSLSLASINISRQNVLSKGYTIASDINSSQHIRSCPNMPPGVVCTRLNDNVNFCKTSIYFQTLHQYIGDDVLRTILRKTNLFIPLLSQNKATIDYNQKDINYIMVCGPPPKISSSSSLSASTKKPATIAKVFLTSPQKEQKQSKATATKVENSDKTVKTTTPCQQMRKKKKRKRQRQNNNNNNNIDGHSSSTTPSRSKSSVLASNAIISRQSLFYSGAYLPKIGLPQTHILNLNNHNNNQNRKDEKEQRKNALQLLEDMIPLLYKCKSNNGSRDGKQRHRRKRWKRIVQSDTDGTSCGIDICTKIIVRHLKCDYARILERHCPLPTYCCTQKKKNNANNYQNNHDTMNDEDQQTQTTSLPSLSDLAKACSPADHVIKFLIKVIHTVFPLEFWGSTHNLNQVLSMVEIFVKLRRCEELPNKTLMKGIRITDVQWLQSSNNKIAASHDEPTTTNDNKDKRRQQQQQQQQRKLSRSDHEATTRLVTYVWRWVFSQYLVPLLRSTFYVTETEFSGKQVMYYRKPVWSMFRSLSMKHLLKDQFMEITCQEAETRIQQQRIGCSRLRLLPKATGVRPIALLSSREDTLGNAVTSRSSWDDPTTDTPDESIDDIPAIKKRKLFDGTSQSTTPYTNNAEEGEWADQFKSANEILRDTFSVLSYEHQRKPHLFGAGILGLHEFYPRYRNFLTTWRHRQKHSNPDLDLTKLYFASVDIRHCYDNIDQGHLLKIVEDNLSEDDYIIQGYSVMYFSRSMDTVVRQRKSSVGPPDSFVQFHKRVDQDSSSCNHGAIFIDDSSCVTAKKRKIMALLQEHMKSHIVTVQGRHGNRYLVQKQGIPQGSIVSSILCNLYYGNIEQTMLDPCLFSQQSTFTNNESTGHLHLLVRVVDDFLLITTDKQIQANFLQIMIKGKSCLGVQVNRDKVYANVDLTLEVEDGEFFKVEDATTKDSSNGYFPWCGMLFDTKSGETRIDYSRFLDGKAQNSLTVVRADHEGKQLSLRMKTFVRPRCLPILFDSCINNMLSTKTNFYDIMLLCAVKTVKYIRSSDLSVHASNTQQLLLVDIKDVVLYSYQLIQSRLAQKVGPEEGEEAKNDSTPSTSLSKHDAIGLGWQAFQTTFRAAGGGFSHILPFISKLLKKHGKRSPEVESHSIVNVNELLVSDKHSR